MKKGVVLLLTLFFMTLLSVLVLKNLDDTDKFLKEQNYVQENTKLLIATKNMQEQVSKLLRDNKSKLKEIFSTDEIKITKPISLDNINIDFSINEYDKTNINNIGNENDDVEALFQDNDIFDYDLFVDIYKKKLDITDLSNKENEKIKNYMQIEDIMNDFVLQLDDDKIYDIEDKLGFKDSNNLYELKVLAKNNSNLELNSYYILNNEGGVEYFETSFK